MEAYLLLKLVHIVSSTLLFGTGLGTAFSMWRADRSGDVAAIAVVSRNVVLADFWFTTPAVIVQPLSGIAMMHLTGLPLATPWIAASLALFVLIGLCWLPVVRIQMQVARIAAEAAREMTALPARYRQLMRWWYALGWPAFLGVIAVFALMVFKPLWD